MTEDQKSIRSATLSAQADEEPIIYEVDDQNTHLQVHHLKKSNGIALAIYEGEALEGVSLSMSSQDANELVEAILAAINGSAGRSDGNWHELMIMARSTGIIRQIEGRDIVWVDDAGFTHLCEGTAGTAEERPSLWTRCQIEVPRNAGYLRMAGEVITCRLCGAIERGF